MARKKSSVLEDVIEIGLRLPWWLSLLLAVGLYFVLHHYAQIPIPKATGAQDMSAPIISSMIKTAASIGQYLIPGLLALGALVGFVKSAVRKLRYERVVADKSGHTLDSLTWLQFERLIHQYFIERGFSVTETQEGADGGVDLRLSKGGHTATVQCKQWHTKKVGVAVVREQFGVMTAEQADQCFVVTSGEFTQEAIAWAADKPIDLIDGQQLRYLLGHVDYDRALFKPLAPTERAGAGTCPGCGSQMVLRTARRGSTAGSRFWGCSNYPKCRQTRDLNT